MKNNLLLAGVLAVSGLVSLGAVTSVSADTETPGFRGAIARVGERFGQDREEHRAARQAEHQAQREQREAQMGDRLDAAVEAGELTVAQKEALLAKHEEMKTSREEWREAAASMTPEERRAAAQQHRAQMAEWAEEQGIPADFVQQGRKQPAQFQHGRGYGHRHQQAE
jgi:hypothetical protein